MHGMLQLFQFSLRAALRKQVSSSRTSMHQLTGYRGAYIKKCRYVWCHASTTFREESCSGSDLDKQLHLCVRF